MNPSNNVLPYTAIYIERWMSGSNWYTNTKIHRFKTDDLSKLMKSDLGQNTQYLFHGWPRLEGESDNDYQEKTSKAPTY